MAKETVKRLTEVAAEMTRQGERIAFILETLEHLATKYCWSSNPRPLGVDEPPKPVWVGPRGPADLFENWNRWQLYHLAELDCVKEWHVELEAMAKSKGMTIGRLISEVVVKARYVDWMLLV